MKPAPIAVLHVLGALDCGGVETWLLDLLARLDRSRWQFDFCTLGPSVGRYAGKAEACESRILSCPIGSRGDVSFLRRFRGILIAGGYQVVHSHVHYFSSLVLAVAQSAGVNVRVAHSHNTRDGAGDGWGRAVYRAAARHLLAGVANLKLACSAEAASALFGGGWRQNPRVKILHYGLDGRLESVPDPLLRLSLGIAGSAPVVGHVGRFDRQKNHAFLLEVAAALRARRPEVRWLLIGDGKGRRAIEQEAARLGLGGTVVFGGLREDVPSLMASVMDAFVLPSLHEGLPLVLLEAQAAGLRSIVSSQVSREAAVVEGAVEFLDLAAGPETWARRILACLERGRIPTQLARGQIRAAGFSAERSLADLLAAYQTALAGVEFER